MEGWLGVYDDLAQLVGRTPLFELRKLQQWLGLKTRVFLKLEYFNPGGSVKDRLALAIVQEAQARGWIQPGWTLVEATSGNTGIGLAMFAARYGYRCVFVMPDKVSVEKQNLMKAYGAEVILTPTGLDPQDPQSHYSVARRYVETHPQSYLVNQYHNPANYQMHERTTGPEIWQALNGQVDALVGGAGTGGTLSGCGRYLKSRNPNIKLILADPVGSILYDLVIHQEIRHAPQSYWVEGVGEDMLPDNFHVTLFDDAVQVSDAQAFVTVAALCQLEGLCLGPSSGLALIGALRWIYEKGWNQQHRHLVVIAPDHGRAYLSKAFNPEWLASKGLPTGNFLETFRNFLGESRV